MHAMNEIHFCKFNSNKNILDLKMSLIAICMFPNITRNDIQAEQNDLFFQPI